VKGWKNIFHPNGKQKKAGVAILISDKIDGLCLWVRAFNPFIFKLIIDIYVLIAILLIVWG